MHLPRRLVRSAALRLPGAARLGTLCAGLLLCSVSVSVFVSVSVSAPASASDRLRVVATLPNLASIAQSVGGDRVEIEAIAEGYQDPHYVNARPSYARRMNRADLVIANGLDLEVGWLPPLLEAARNPAVRPGRPGFVDASASVERVLDVPEGSVDRSHGDVHPFGNPHYDLDPRNAAGIARAVAEALAAIDPEGAGTYRERAAAFAVRMETRIAEWEALAAPLRGRPVVSYHQQWEYLADWLGFEIVGQVEDRPGIPPTPRHVGNLIREIRERAVPVVLAAPYNDRGQAQAVAERSGAALVVLPTAVGAEDGIGSYEQLIDTIVRRLVAAARVGQPGD